MKARRKCNSAEFFKAIPTGYTYDSLTLRPLLSTINSRSDVDLSSEILPGIVLKIPIIASPMVTICESRMCLKMFNIGGLGILHRFAPVEYLKEEMVKMQEIPQTHRAFAVGIREGEREAVLNELAPMAGIACVDVNIGHHIKTIDTVKLIKDKYPHLKIIAGNVSTYDGAVDLIEAGADCIRATNGGGSACTTLTVTGVGLPTATSLHECACAAREHGKTVLSCGGHKNSSSMVVALALGADAVIIGGLLSGSSGCPEHAYFIDENGERKARYFGMASRKAQDIRDGMKPGTAPEGVSKIVNLKGKTDSIIDQLAGGIRSGLSFCDAHTLQELREKAEFIRWR